jgi:glycosyltransferase involved in cell wall biosynthesis
LAHTRGSSGTNRAPLVILFLHNRYRTTGGEERAVEDLMWLVREHLHEDAELLSRDSATIGRARAAAGLLGGGVAPEQVAAAVRRSGARVVHAHNVNPSLGWRALAAARAAGARTILHLHNYRLVCAVGTCFTRGADCTRCHGRNTLPGVRLNCRGTGREAAVYGAGLALWQRRLVEAADALVVPSSFAHQRLQELGAPLIRPVHVVGHVVRDVATASSAARGLHALVASRLAPEKGVDVAIAACAAAGLPLVVAGDGPQRAALEARAAGTGTRFAGHVDEPELARLRAQAALALVPSRAAETFGLAAAEAMAAGVPVAGSAIGALPELCGTEGLVEPGDAAALALAARARFRDAAAGDAGRRRVLALASPQAVGEALTAVYDGAG